VALAAGTQIGGGLAAACGLDNVPSLFADGQLDRFNNQPPITAAQLASWAPFILPRRYRTGHAIVFTENRREVAKSLVPAAMRRPWRWHFGDGNMTYGWTVHHAYARPGTWLVVVDAYDSSTGQWYYFDKVNVTVIAAPHQKHS
ncbi:MAG TPA: PKD domain-containing protein, partial [Chloroflexota bacterium]|nr:PKD domain-containing protein [Chloroflexota bacterium]